MNESSLVIDTAIEKIKTLFSEEKYVEAHRGCLEILRFDPDNIKVIRLKNKIEKEVKKINTTSLRQDLDNLKPLLEQKKYEELLEHLKHLQPYINQYPPLKSFIIKAQNEYKKYITAQQKAYFAQKIVEIDTLKKKKKYEEAMKIIFSLKRDKIKLNELKKYTQKLEKEWIDHELEIGKIFIQTEKFDDILIWLQKLKQISGKNKKLNRIMQRTKERQLIFKVEQKKDFIYTGTEKIKTLLQLGKFEKATEAAKEILDIDPTNSAVRRMLRIAAHRETKRVDKLLIQQMRQAHKEMRKDYKANKNDFVGF